MTAATAAWTRKDLTGIEPLSCEELEIIFDRAEFYHSELKEHKRYDALANRTVVNLFLENSTRTRTAFEVSARRLGADVISISGSASSLTKE